MYLLTPLNFILSFDSSLRIPFYNDCQKYSLFPQAKNFEKHWKEIKQESLNLLKCCRSQNYLDDIKYEIDTVNWDCIPIKYFDFKNYEYITKCPILDILLNDNKISSCFVSRMSPGKVLKTHTNPFDGTLRYQLALEIPHGDAHLEVDGQQYLWKEGESLMFDGTYPHSALNNTSKDRIVLLIDVKRNYNFFGFKILNELFIKTLGFLRP